MPEVDSEANAYVMYHIDCVSCGDVFITEFDPSGLVVECDCEAQIYVRNTL